MTNKDRVITMAEFNGKIKDNVPQDQRITELQGLIDFFRASLEVQKEFHRWNAILLRAKYVSLVEAGFTEQQALMLCK